MNFTVVDKRLDLSPELALEYLFKYYKGGANYNSGVILQDQAGFVFGVSNQYEDQLYEVISCDLDWKEDYIFVNGIKKKVKPFEIDLRFDNKILRRGLYLLKNK